MGDRMLEILIDNILKDVRCADVVKENLIKFNSPLFTLFLITYYQSRFTMWVTWLMFIDRINKYVDKQAKYND